PLTKRSSKELGARFNASYCTHDTEPGNGGMLILNPLEASERSVLVGYAVAVLTVAAAFAALLLMQTRWQASAPVSLLLAAVIVIRHGDRISYANPAASAITGHSFEELRAMSFSDTGHPDFQNLLRARALAREKGELVPVRYELKIVTKAGEERWLGFTEGVF